METVFNFRVGLSVLLLALAGACGDDGGGDTELNDADTVIEAYATNVHANYSEALTTATALKTAIDAFVAAPDAPKFQAAKDAWLAARVPYGQTEAFRFYDGPIDDPDSGPEGQINAWPLDEAYIDYTTGAPDGGLINDTTFTIDKESIAGKNEEGSDTNIATGYHAIEFLLWGEDLSDSGPGARPYTDYLPTGGTATNQVRRGDYLKAAAALLVDDLTAVRDQWAAGGTNYRADFTAVAPREAVRRMLQGMGSLAGAELSGERMQVALDNADQEDEHSCFSDNTTVDIAMNARSVENVYLGRYGTTDGDGIDKLVEARDPALNAKMKAQLTATNEAIEAVADAGPFDQSIINNTELVETAIAALQAETATIIEIGELLGIQITQE